MRKTLIDVCTATRKSPVDQVACIEKEIAGRRTLLKLAKVEEAKRELALKKLQQLLMHRG